MFYLKMKCRCEMDYSYAPSISLSAMDASALPATPTVLWGYFLYMLTAGIVQCLCFQDGSSR